MLPATARAAATALSALLLLTACSGSDDLPEVQVPQAERFQGESVVGFMADANAQEVTLRMPDGSPRTFAVRAEDRDRVGIDHLASHVGFTDIGFEVFYVTEDGTDYVVAAQEVAPPRVTSTAPAASTTIELVVAGGQVSGDTGRVEVAAGEPVSLTVTADVADQVHVHGYDLVVDTVPGQPAQLSFVADAPGVFEVELEGSGTLLTRLQVR